MKGNGEKDNKQSCCACIYQAASGSCTAQTALLINPKQKNIENSSTDTALIITQGLVAGTSKSCSLAVVCEYICAYKRPLQYLLGVRNLHGSSTPSTFLPSVPSIQTRDKCPVTQEQVEVEKIGPDQG